MRKLTNEEIDKRIEKINPNIKRIGECVKSKILVECKKDGHIWKAGIQDLFGGHGCPKCANVKVLTNEEIDEKIKNRNLKRLDNYIRCNVKINFQCLKCNNILYVKPNDILMGHGCPKCAKVKKLTNEEIDIRIKSKNIERIDNYINNRTKIKFKCLNNNCGFIWEAKPNNILDCDNGCPNCSIGKSEKHIHQLIIDNVQYNYLKRHKLIYYNERKYFVDFYLEINNTKIIIEYNGSQHYEPVRFGGISKKRALENFKKQILRDAQIRTYCQTNNIYLLEIPYTMNETEIIEKLKCFSPLHRLPY